MANYVQVGQSRTSVTANTQRAVVKVDVRPFYVLMYGEPGIRKNAGKVFQWAAETKARELEEQENAETLVTPVTNFEEFKAAIEGAVPETPPLLARVVSGVYFFGHASSQAIFVGENAWAGTNVDLSNVFGLTPGNMRKNANVWLYCCNAGNTASGMPCIAELMADIIRRDVYAFSSGMHYQNSPELRGLALAMPLKDRKPMYLVPDNGKPATLFPKPDIHESKEEKYIGPEQP